MDVLATQDLMSDKYITIYWIGAYHHPKLGWQWTDGSGFGYNKWIHSQENGDDYDYDMGWKCVAVSEATGLWIQTDCNEMHGTVCKIVAKVKPEIPPVVADVKNGHGETTEQEVTTDPHVNEIPVHDIGRRLKHTDKDKTLQENDEPKHSLGKNIIVILLLLGLLLILIFIVFFLLFKRQKMKKFATRRMFIVSIRRESDRKNILTRIDLSDAADEEETTA